MAAVPLSGTTVGRGRDESGTEGAMRVADVLRMFTTGSATLGVSEIARHLGLSKAVVHRILKSLASRQFVQVDPLTSRYRLGPAAVALGAQALGRVDLRHAARPVLRRLRDETAETTTVSQLFGTSRIYLDQFESPHEIKMTVGIGRAHPLHLGATGHAMLAFLDQTVQDEVLAGPLERLTPASITEPDELRRILSETRRNRFSVSHGQRLSNASSIASPIFGVDGEVLGAVSLCGPIERFDTPAIKRYSSKVCLGADEISRSLGWRGCTQDDR